MIDPRDPVTKAYQTFVKMQNDRSSWDSHWQEIETRLLPRSGRFSTTERNKGSRRNNIIDNTGTRSLRILAAGLMGGATNPSRPWFRLATPDRDKMKIEEVKIWLNTCTQIMLDIFARSNTYTTLQGLYKELGAFGTACSIINEDYDNVINHNALTIGEFSLATSARGIINRMGREFEITVFEAVEQFGYSKVSNTIQRLFDQGKMLESVPVVHLIEPRAERDPNKRDNLNMAFKSIYFEPACMNHEKALLSESGFKTFPALTPRWDVTSNNIYGDSPGMEALGDTKALQHEQVRKAEGIDFKTRPPLQVPTKLKGRALDRLPGGVSYYDPAQPQGGVRPLYEVNIDLSHLLEDIQDVRKRIENAFYTDLFFAISMQDAGKMTATEVAARNQEQLLQLGPVLERLHNELLKPLVDMTFQKAIAARLPNGESLLPPPPQELEGEELKIEFISMIAQAQRAINTNTIDRFTMSLGSIAMIKPGVLDKFDENKWADIYADSLGIDPELIVPNEEVALVQAQRNKDMQAMQQSATMNQTADTAAKLASADTGGKNALSDLTGQLAE